MRAFQVVGFGAPLASRALAVPLPEAREVVVDVGSCGLCHSDAHFRQGHISLGGDQNLPVAMLGIQTPVTPGHENLPARRQRRLHGPRSPPQRDAASRGTVRRPDPPGSCLTVSWGGYRAVVESCDSRSSNLRPTSAFRGPPAAAFACLRAALIFSAAARPLVCAPSASRNEMILASMVNARFSASVSSLAAKVAASTVTACNAASRSAAAPGRPRSAATSCAARAAGKAEATARTSDASSPRLASAATVVADG